MSIADEIQRIKTNISNSYSQLELLGAEMPMTLNSDNLASTITTISTGGDNSLLKDIIEGNSVDIILPDEITQIRDWLFKIESNAIPFVNSIVANGVTRIGIYAFQYQGLTKVEMLNLETIDSYAFDNNEINNFYNLPKLKKIGGYAFRNNKQLIVFDLKNVNELGSNCFNNCTSLEMADLSSATYLSQSVFSGCASLRKVWIPSTIETIDATSSSKSTFYNGNVNAVIYTDVASADEVPSGWGTYWNKRNTTTLNTVYGATYEDFLNA